MNFRSDQTFRCTAATSCHAETRGILPDVINVTLGFLVAEADTPAAKGRNPADIFL